MDSACALMEKNKAGTNNSLQGGHEFDIMGIPWVAFGKRERKTDGL